MFRRTSLMMGIVILAALFGCQDNASQDVQSEVAARVDSEEAIQPAHPERVQDANTEPLVAEAVEVGGSEETESEQLESEEHTVSPLPDPLLVAADPAEVLGSVDSAQGVSPPPAPGPYDAYAAALELLQQGDARGAIGSLEALLNEFAGDPVARAKVRTNMARAYLKLAGRELSSEHLPKARKLTEDALTLNPESSDVWNVRGRVLLASNRPVEAKQAFRKAIDLDPDNVHACNNLGYTLILGGNFAEALTPLEAAVAAAGRIGTELPAYVFNNLGIALEHNGRLAEARDAFWKAADAGHPTAGEGLARIESLLPYQAPMAEPVPPEEKQEPVSAAASR